MIYKIIWDEKALEKLDKLEPIVAKRIVKKVNELFQDPFSKDIKKLKGMAGYRFRIGYYRVIFDIMGDEIHITNVGHRKHIYDR